ncbi:MAG: hypothetical protein MUF03_14625 [Rubrivivax sp.]|nr:hypothetical protein [Rubrivivax sp.]
MGEYAAVIATPAGVLVGGLINFLASRTAKRHEWRPTLARDQIPRREHLYADYLAEARRLTAEEPAIDPLSETFVEAARADPGRSRDGEFLQSGLATAPASTAFRTRCSGLEPWSAIGSLRTFRASAVRPSQAGAPGAAARAAAAPHRGGEEVLKVA